MWTEGEESISEGNKRGYPKMFWMGRSRTHWRMTTYDVL